MQIYEFLVVPVGLQIVGRHRDDFDVLQLAHALEQATGTGRRRPALSRTAAPGEEKP